MKFASTLLLILSALAGQAFAGGASFFPPADFRKTGGNVEAFSDFLVGLESSSRFSATSVGSAVNNPTQDAIRVQPSGVLSAFYRPFAVYETSLDTDPTTFVGPAETYGGIAYNFGPLRMVSETKSLLIGKEDGFDFFDFSSDVDVGFFHHPTGSLIYCGPAFGATIQEGTSGAHVQVTSGGDFHILDGTAENSSIDGGPTYGGIIVSADGDLNMEAKLGSAEMRETTFASNISAYSTGQISVIARGDFLQLESTDDFALVRGATNAFLSALGGHSSVAASTSVRLGPGNSLVLPSDTGANLNDNLVDVGSAANRFRTGRFGTSVVVGASTTYGDGTITTTGGGGVLVDGNATTSRSAYGPWTMVNLAAGVTNGTLDIPTAAILPTAASRIKMPFAGRIKAISTSGSAARTAGTATFTVFKNGAVVAGTPSVVIDGTNTQRHQASNGTATFVAGDDIQVVATTNAAWAPATAEWAVFIVVEWTS